MKKLNRLKEKLKKSNKILKETPNKNELNLISKDPSYHFKYFLDFGKISHSLIGLSAYSFGVMTLLYVMYSMWGINIWITFISILFPILCYISGIYFINYSYFFSKGYLKQLIYLKNVKKTVHLKNRVVYMNDLKDVLSLSDVNMKVELIKSLKDYKESAKSLKLLDIYLHKGDIEETAIIKELSNEISKLMFSKHIAEKLKNTGFMLFFIKESEKLKIAKDIVTQDIQCSEDEVIMEFLQKVVYDIKNLNEMVSDYLELKYPNGHTFAENYYEGKEQFTTLNAISKETLMGKRSECIKKSNQKEYATTKLYEIHQMIAVVS